MFYVFIVTHDGWIIRPAPPAERSCFRQSAPLGLLRMLPMIVGDSLEACEATDDWLANKKKTRRC